MINTADSSSVVQWDKINLDNLVGFKGAYQLISAQK